MKNYGLFFVFAIAFSAVPTSRADSYDALRELIDQALDNINAIDELVKEQSITSEVIGRIVGEGFEYYSSSSTVMKTRNLRASFYDRYVDLMLPRFGVPPKDQQEIKEKVFDRLKEDTEPGKWVQHKMLFNPADDPEHTKYIGVFGYVRLDGNFDLIILDIKASFKLAKDLLIIYHKDTGEISLEEEELDTDRVPEGEVDKADVQVLLKFFEATALRILSKQI